MAAALRSRDAETPQRDPKQPQNNPRVSLVSDVLDLPKTMGNRGRRRSGDNCADLSLPDQRVRLSGQVLYFLSH